MRKLLKGIFGGVGCLCIIAGFGNIGRSNIIVVCLFMLEGILLLPLPFYNRMKLWLECVIKIVIFLVFTSIAGILFYVV